MRFLKKLFWPIVVSLLIVLGWAISRQATFPIFQPDGVISNSQRTLFLFVLGFSAIIILPVFSLLIFIILRYHEGNTKAKYRPDYDKNNKLEVVYWGIPILMIITLATITWVTSHTLDPYVKIPSKNKTLEIQVVALEWKWLFIYPKQQVATVNELPVPVNTPLHFDITADAPMSAFWIPELGSQIYAMNGMDSQLNLMATKKGTFMGYNTNINGEGYASMTFQTHALDQKGFDAWVKAASASHDVLDQAVNKQLAKASVQRTPSVYRLGDNTLFDQTIMKYMGSDNSSKSMSMSGMGM
jgi:cytochrome o ubiquinol oxidase subunit 2